MARTLFRRNAPPESPPPEPPTAEPDGGGKDIAPPPLARFTPGRVATARHRNLAWLLGGILLVLVCALGGVLLVTSSDDRVDAVVAARDLEPGAPVARDDLRVVRVGVDADVSTVTPVEAGELIGKSPLGRVPAGAVLSAGMFSSSSPLGDGEVVFGAALDPGEAPLSEVEQGTEVRLLLTAPTKAGDDLADVTATVLGDGTVWASETLGTGQLWLTIRADESVALDAAQASRDDSLRVVLAGG